MGSTSSLRKMFVFMLVPKSLWTLPSASSLKPRKAPRKQVQCHRCFLFDRMSPKCEYEARRRIERKRDVCPRRRLWEFGPNDDATHFWKLAESKGKTLQRRRSLCQLGRFFRVALGRAPGLYTQCVCQVTIESLAFRKLGFLERQSAVSSFSSQVLFQTSDASTLSLKNPNPNSNNRTCQRETGDTRCTVGGDDVWTLTIQETRLSCRSTVAYFSSKVLSKTSNAPT